MIRKAQAPWSAPTSAGRLKATRPAATSAPVHPVRRRPEGEAVL
ncbi:hypothetical protein ACFOU2_06480 [Bacillus songklensis]|uniref:Uncharacterized protein n=1 Tax=Bacillus songklensis TaxID=1069116 RepID=A0ABV8AZS0_9BACI